MLVSESVKAFFEAGGSGTNHHLAMLFNTNQQSIRGAIQFLRRNGVDIKCIRNPESNKGVYQLIKQEKVEEPTSLPEIPLVDLMKIYFEDGYYDTNDGLATFFNTSTDSIRSLISLLCRKHKMKIEKHKIPGCKKKVYRLVK